MNVKSRKNVLKVRLTVFLVSSSSLCEGKLCRLHLLLLLLTSHNDQGEKRKHRPSYQKPLHLYRQQVGTRAAVAVWFGAVAPQHGSVPTRELFCAGFACSPRRSVSGFLSQPRDMHAMLIGHSKQSASSSQQTAN